MPASMNDNRVQRSFNDGSMVGFKRDLKGKKGGTACHYSRGSAKLAPGSPNQSNQKGRPAAIIAQRFGLV
jgi:hypothetical protein